MASRKQEPQKFCLLDLPAELLLLIFEEVFVRPSHVYPAGQVQSMHRLNPTRSEHTTRRLPHIANFLASCTQIHAEGAKIFFTRNTFYVTNGPYQPVLDVSSYPHYTSKNRRKFAPSYAPLVRHITSQTCRMYGISDEAWQLVKWVFAIKFCTDLRTLRLELAWDDEGIAKFRRFQGSHDGTTARKAAVAKVAKNMRKVALFDDVVIPRDLEVDVCVVNRLDQSTHGLDLAILGDGVMEMWRKKDVGMKALAY